MKDVHSSYLTPKVLLNWIWVLEVPVTLDEVSIFILSFQFFVNVENSKSFVGSQFSQKEDLWFRNYETF